MSRLVFIWWSTVRDMPVTRFFSKCRQKFTRLTHYTIKRFFLRLKMTHAHANIGLSSIQTLSKSPSERTSVSPLISSELHVDYKWWDFPVNLSNLSGENMMKFASRSTRPLRLLMRGEVPDVSHSAGTNTCERSLSRTLIEAQTQMHIAWPGQKQEVQVRVVHACFLPGLIESNRVQCR